MRRLFAFQMQTGTYMYSLYRSIYRRSGRRNYLDKYCCQHIRAGVKTTRAQHIFYPLQRLTQLSTSQERATV